MLGLITSSFLKTAFMLFHDNMLLYLSLSGAPSPYSGLSHLPLPVLLMEVHPWAPHLTYIL